MSSVLKTDERGAKDINVQQFEGCKQLNKKYTNLPIYYYNR